LRTKANSLKALVDVRLGVSLGVLSGFVLVKNVMTKYTIQLQCLFQVSYCLIYTILCLCLIHFKI